MQKNNTESLAIKYLTPDNLYAQIKNFTSGMAVSKGSFELTVERCLVKDVEWNHMDQMHRPTIHNTYDKGIRIATGSNFAVSLTQWGKWPFFITVSDVYVAKGLFYQSLTIAGIIFVHSVISLEQQGENVKLKDEWYIGSHKIFKILHPILNKKLYKLNARLQEEDEPVRQGRLALRKKGYQFRTDVPNYYNSNLLSTNTIYPELQEDACFDLQGITETPSHKSAGNIEFIVQKSPKGSYLIWPAACPHEGGPLIDGKFCDKKLTCPWHGLHFLAAELTPASPFMDKHGFEYHLQNNLIFVRHSSVRELRARIAADGEQ